MKFLVLEVDQHTGTGDIAGRTLEEVWQELDGGTLEGGDAPAQSKICSIARIREVDENAQPSWGYTWFREDDEGKLYRWKHNWDTSG